MTQPAPESGGLFSGLGFWITDGPAAVAASSGPACGGAAGPGQGFSLRQGEAMDLLRRAENTLIDLRVVLTKAEGLTQMSPPAKDPASSGYHTRVVGAGAQGAGAFGSGITHVRREYDYLSELARRLRDALGLTQRTDTQNADAVARVGQARGIL